MMINFSWEWASHISCDMCSGTKNFEWKVKGGGTLSIHICGDYDTAEVLIRIINSVNQLSIYGAVADLCEELGLYQSGKPLIGTKKPSAVEKAELLVSLADFSNISRPLLNNQPAQENLLQDHKEREENLSDHDQETKIMQRCWIHKYCCCWTVFYDGRCWRVLKF